MPKIVFLITKKLFFCFLGLGCEYRLSAGSNFLPRHGLS